MNVDYRYSLENGSKKYQCPQCGKKTFVRYIDRENANYLPEQYGRCDRESKCNYHLNPYLNGYVNTNDKTTTKKITWKPTQIDYYKILSAPANAIDFEKQYFTEIDTFSKGGNSRGVLHYFSLNKLCERLNQYRRGNGGKTNNPAILKGIYKGGTSGEYCTTSAPFLFFDIDVKENENTELLNKENNAKVFKALKDFSLLVWRSNSQRGIAGVLYFPQLAWLDSTDNEKHLTIAKEAYNYLSNYLLKRTGIRVKFDNAQGKFRQIRYLAEQKDKRYINNNSQCLFFEQLPFIPLPDEVFHKTLTGYEQNTFIQNLLSRVPYPFPPDEVVKLIERYRLGTTKAGAVCFPFIDKGNNVRAIQVKQFDDNNHTLKTSFLHSIIERDFKDRGQQLPKWLEDYNKQDKKVNCLFGEHLLTQYPNSPIALVEAPKTAIYCDLYLRKYGFIWLAVYNKSSFKFDKLKVLQGRFVYVFPDLSEDGKTFKEWKDKANEYESRLPGTRFIFSDLLEQLAPNNAKTNGNDIADFLIEQDWRKYNKKKYEEYTKEERLKFGLNYFKFEDLKQLGIQIFSKVNKLNYKQITSYLENIENLNQNDREDILDILCIRKIINPIEYPYYTLN